MVSWMISSTTDVPEAAMKFLNLTYTDADVINLLIYGIEGRDYVKTMMELFLIQKEKILQPYHIQHS